MDNNKTEQLLDFLAQTTEQHLRVEEDLGLGFVKLNIEEAQRRQAKHDIRSVEDIVIELLRNSRDAKAKNILIASWKIKSKIRKMVVIDDGHGIPATIQNRIFEARVTSKLDKFSVDEYGVHGRGMALFSIAQNSQAIIVNSQLNRGTVIKIIADTSKLTETADQSTAPKVIATKQGIKVLGPNNVLKTTLDFNLKYPDISIYYGSPSEIAALLFSFSSHSFSSKEPFSKTKSKYIHCLSHIQNAEDLAQIVKQQYELNVSARNCHRILAGEITPPLSINEAFQIIKLSSKKKLERSLAGHLRQGDLAQLQNSLFNIFNSIGSKYFIKLSDLPKVERAGNQIKIILLLEKVEEI